VFSLTDTLTVNGSSVSFDGFSIANLAGFDNSVPVGTYFLLDGAATVNTANLANLGVANAFLMGDTGKQAYFENRQPEAGGHPGTARRAARRAWRCSPCCAAADR
jgi:hypothetical protein